MKRPVPITPAPPRYVDRPEVDEVFADRLEHLFFDGGQVRMEFTVTRSEPTPSGPSGEPPQQWAYTACRLVLSARGAAEMLNMMNELRVVLARAGVITVEPQGKPQAAQSAAPDSPPPPGEPVEEPAQSEPEAEP